MKKILSLFLVAIFLSWSLAFADLAPSRHSPNVSYSPKANTSNVDLNSEVELGSQDRAVVSEQILNNIDPNGPRDIAPFTSIGGDLPVITDFQDSILCFTLDTLTDTQFLGIEFDGTNFWITGGNSAADPNKLYKYDTAGNLLNTYDQSSADGWGWRDLTWDGAYLYGSDSTYLVQIDPATGMATGVRINGPEFPNRALAYDPATDHFWTANFSGNIYEFSRAGTIIHTFTNSKSVYGMAWDTLSTDGPWLWVFSQDGPGVDTLMEVSQFDPVAGTYTGRGFQADVPTGYLGAIAGGACFTDWGTSDEEVLFLLGQGDPTDFVYGFDMFPIPVILGSCCNDATGACVDNVEQYQCPSPARWTAGVLCADLQPPCGTVFGACCDDQGNCTQTTEQDCPGLWMADTPCDPNPCPAPPPCTLSCPTNGIPEGEPDCYENYDDVYNGGCNSTPPVFSTYNVGDTVCGKAGTFLFGTSNYRDTDWYELTITSDATLFLTGIAEFDMYMVILDPGSGDCSDFSSLAEITIPACSTGVISAPVSPGTYWLFASTAVFQGVACGSNYQIWTELGAAPTGACCVNDQCVTTNTFSECQVLQGDWYIGETCPDFTCPSGPATCAGAVYTNGEPIDDYGSPASQCAPDYPFVGAAVDDITVNSNTDFGKVVTWTTHWNGNVGGPAAYTGVNITLYYDDIDNPGRPAGEPVDTCDHVEYQPGGIFYTEFVDISNINYELDYSGCAGDVYRMEVPLSNTVTLAAGTLYWIEIQPVMTFAAPGGQVAIQLSNINTGVSAQQIFPAAGLPVWQNVAGNDGTCQPVGQYFDLAFCLLPAGGGGGCDYVVGDANGSGGFNGLDVTFSVNWFKYGTTEPLCPIGSCPIAPCDAFYYCGDVNASCNFNGLDVTYAVNWFKYGVNGPIPCADCPPNP